MLGTSLFPHVGMWVWLGALFGSLFVAVVCRRWPMAQSLCVLLATLFAGCVLVTHAELRLQVAYVDRPVGYEGVVFSEPEERGKVVQFDMMMAEGPYQGKKVRAALLRDTVQHRYRNLHLGDGIMAQSVIERARRFLGSTFDYPFYLHVRDFVGTTFIYYNAWQKKSVSTGGIPVGSRLRLRMLLLRQRLLQHTAHLGLSDEAASLLTAMTLGNKQQLSTATRDVYQATGVSHVLALSGLHLGIIYMLLVHLLPRRRHALLREVVLLAAIWAYVLLVGMSPSVVRAATMVSVYAFTRLLNRRGQPLNALALAATVLMVANPLCIYDVGFQLSFTAVLFILFFFKPLYGVLPERWLQRWRVLRWLWSMVVMSIVAQVGTAPLVMHYFGTFAVYFLPANLIVVPLAILLIYGMLLLLLLTPFPGVQQGVASILSALVAWQHNILSAIASWHGATITDIQLSTMQTWLVYVMMAVSVGVVIVLRRGRIKKVHSHIHPINE